jgi:sugar phosphate isomerase/epimerase
MVQRLLNISTHPGEPEMFDNDWRRAAIFLEHWEFDGFELYPVGDYPFERIPAEIVTGLHLRFFIILAPIWRGDRRRLLEIFGDWQTVERYYGGRDAEWIASFYTCQLDLAHRLGCAYVVFHPVHCELDYVYNWQFPWKVNDTLDLCAEVINAATVASAFKGRILFENLWWPGSFRLDSPREYDYLLSRVDHPRCGIALDTGHLLNKNPCLTDEREAADYLLDCIDNLGEIARHIHAVHLSLSLSGGYIRRTQRIRDPFNGVRTFWDRLDQARRHVGRIDRHEPFKGPGIAAMLEKVDPAHLVFEFSFNGMPQWEEKIATQKRALRECLWPHVKSVKEGHP